MLIKLARLEPVASAPGALVRRKSSMGAFGAISSSSSGDVARTYVCTRSAVEDAFLEVATDLLLVDLEELGPPGADGAQQYRLITDVARLFSLTPASATTAPTAGAQFETDPLAMADYMGLYEFDPSSASGMRTVPINLDSHQDVLTKCDHIVNTLATEVRMHDLAGLSELLRINHWRGRGDGRLR